MDNIYILFDEIEQFPKYIPIITDTLSNIVNEILYRVDKIEIAGNTLFENNDKLKNINEYIKKVENSDNLKNNMYNTQEYVENSKKLKDLIIKINRLRDRYKYLRNYLSQSQKRKYAYFTYETMLQILNLVEEIYNLKIKLYTIENNCIIQQIQSRQELIMYVYQNLSGLSQRQRQRELVNVKQFENELSEALKSLNNSLKDFNALDEIRNYYREQIDYLRNYVKTKDESYLLQSHYYIGGEAHMLALGFGDEDFKFYRDNEILLNEWGTSNTTGNDTRLNQVNRNLFNQNNAQLNNLTNQNNIFTRMFQRFRDAMDLIE